MSAPQRTRSNPDRAPWAGGAILIVIGLVFLIRQMTGFELRNWWALFILIPAIPAYTMAYSYYQQDEGRFTNRVLGAMLGGITPTVIALIFLLNLSWGGVWPLLLIMAGVSAILSESTKPNPPG